MAKPTKRRVQGGRVTPRGTRPENEATPRVPVTAEKVSPIWVPVLMIALLALGAIVIVLNYVALLPGGHQQLVPDGRPGSAAGRDAGSHPVALANLLGSRHVLVTAL